MVSGNGSNLQAILDACADGRIDADVVAVVSNRPDVFALQRADAAGVPAVHIGLHPDEERAEYDARLADLIAGFEPDLVVLAGWMRVLTMSFLGWFPRQVINLHPALPGEFPGTRAIERALDEALAGLRTSSGVMVHLVPDDGRRRRAGPGHRRGADRRRRLARRVRASRARHRTPPARAGARRCVRRPDDHRHGDRPSGHDGTTTDRNGDPRMTDHSRSNVNRSNVNDEFFDRFEALTFDDVVVVPGYSETLPDAVDTTRALRRRHRTRRAAGVGRDGQGHRGTHGRRHGPPRRHRRDPPQHVDRRPGRRGPEGQALPVGDDHRPGHAAPDRAAPRRRGADAPVQVLRRARSPTPTGGSSASSRTATSASAPEPTSTARSPTS